MRSKKKKELLKLCILSGALAVLAMCLAWKPLLLKGDIPADSLMMTHSHPNWGLLRTAWEEPGWPLWNPRRNMGEPHLADPQTMTLYPPARLLAGWTDFRDFLRCWVVFHTLLAAGFMALLAFRWYADPAAAMAAASLAGLNGFFTSRLSVMNNFASGAWLPAILYFQSTLSPLGLALCLTLQVFAGFPVFVLMSLLGAGALALHQGRAGWRCFLKGSIAALGLSAVQFIPFLEMMAHSERPLILSEEAAFQFSTPLAQLAKEIFVPLWYAFAPQLEGDPAIVTFYVGLIALGFAVWGTIRGDRRAKYLGGFVLVTFLFSLGGEFPGSRLLPFLRVFRFPSNWFYLSTAGIALLAAGGISLLRKRPLRWLAASLILADLLLFSQFTRFAWARPEYYSDVPLMARSILSQGPFHRIYHTETLLKRWRRGFLEKEEDYLLMRDTLAPSFATPFGIEEVSSYQTLRSKRSSRYRARMSRAGPDSDLWDYAGVSHALTLSPGADAVTGETIRIVLNENAKGRVFVFGAPGAGIKILSYRAGEVRVRVDAPQRAVVVMSEISYPGWTATLDGHRSPVEAFEEAFVSTEVPAGRHDLTFKYSPNSVWIGLALSLTTLVLLVLGRRRRFV